MRLFTGLDLAPEVAGRLADLLERLRPAARIAWSPPANLHITTKFIGEWPEERLEELQLALAALGGRAPIPVHVGALGFYPNPRSPRVFWCGVEAPGLAELAGDTDAATVRLGIESEKRAYSPHLTLARIRERVDLRILQERIAALGTVDLGRFEVRSFFLYRSQLRPAGSLYTKLAEFPLSK
ncbi:MAG: RNA 2',3'-cyclic phosphodiesterase [Bryobacteraceae bacterium]